MRKETKFVLEAPIIGWGTHHPNSYKVDYTICFLDPQGEHCTIGVSEELFALAILPNKILKVEISVVS